MKSSPSNALRFRSTRAMIETFNTAVDFVDFRALEPIVEAVR